MGGTRPLTHPPLVLIVLLTLVLTSFALPPIPPIPPLGNLTSLSIPNFIPPTLTNQYLEHVQALIPTILSQHVSTISPDGPTIHGLNKDYTVCALTSSQETGVLPVTHMDVDQLLHYLERGFTLIVNSVERHSFPLLSLSQALKSAVKRVRVKGNLYVTPNLRNSDTHGEMLASNKKLNVRSSMSHTKNQGFETHYDYMDVLVLHLSSQPKTWRVWNETCHKNPTESTKAKPSEFCLAGRSRLVVLKKGDLLYIRRGTLHHAYVDEGEGVEDDPTSNPNDDSYIMPKIIKGAAVHITFGFVLERPETVVGLLERMQNRGVCEELKIENVGGQDYLETTEAEVKTIILEIERVCGGKWGGEDFNNDNNIESRTRERERQAEAEEMQKEKDVQRRVMIINNNEL
ncbi:hypothetical protein TrVE_jg1938 [Triparma verrucosa]|uniref:Bifunctional lysine-specific demethylase and histidyl-hydroxylase n=1 Tax=Triparma verrucosa TaxID=1606542 RepID=A0A9W7BK06_9STRA|nr:hypothetical protein TrVE_jg1938 [Triparma verrucosa]